MKKLQFGVVLFSLMFVLAGCGTFGKKDEDEGTDDGAAVEDRAPAGDGSAESYGVDESGGFQGQPLDDPDETAPSVRVIYFDLDSAEVKEEYRAVVQAHARFLANDPGTGMTLEGHADERGSREYNLALGERRANTIRRQMVLMGASAEQLRSVSYGEERPVRDGHDESFWSLNRRVEIIY